MNIFVAFSCKSDVTDQTVIRHAGGHNRTVVHENQLCLVIVNVRFQSGLDDIGGLEGLSHINSTNLNWKEYYGFTERIGQSKHFSLTIIVNSRQMAQELLTKRSL